MADEVDSGGATSDRAGPATAAAPAAAAGPATAAKPAAAPTAAAAAEPARAAKPATGGSTARPAGLDDDEDDRGDWRGRIWSALLTVVGAVSLVCGLTWALITLGGPEPFLDLASGIVVALGGLVLLMPHRIRLPGVATGIAAVVTGVGGTVAGLTSGTATACCMFAYIEDRGFPFVWLQRGGVADDPAVAQRLAATDSWSADVSMLTMNLIIWAYLGVLVVALVVLVRRATSRR